MKKYLSYIIVSALAVVTLSVGAYAVDETSAEETTPAAEETTAAATTEDDDPITDVTIDEDADLEEDEDSAADDDEDVVDDEEIDIDDGAAANPGTGVGLMTLGLLAAGTAGAAAAFRKRK